MSKFGIIGATALSLTLAVAGPALAAGRGGGSAHFGGGGGAHFAGGGGMRGGGAMNMGGGGAFRGAQASTAFRGAQASMGPSPVGGGNNFAARGGAQFAQGGYRGGHDHGRGFGRGVGFAAGLAAGGALGYGYGGYYDPGYYSDDYANNDYYDGGYPAGPGYVVSSGADPAYCAQRYRSYDPGSGTYLGYDGLRHPCGE